MPEANQLGVQRVVILGGGVAGWMAAAGLAQAVGRRATVTVLEQPGDDHSLGPFGPAEASLPSIRRFHDLIGLDENALVCSGAASFALGIVLTGWSAPGHDYIRPFGAVGASLGAVAFHQLAGRLRAEGQIVRLADYSLAAICAQAGRFARPSQDERSPLSAYDYGLHVHMPTYAALLRRQAERLGAVQRAGSLRDVERGPNGSVAALLLESGERIEGDLFIDGSGSRAELISRLEPGFESWGEWIPFDRVRFHEQAAAAQPPCYAHAEASATGWTRRIPLPGRIAETFFYNSQFEANDAPALAFTPGRRRSPWAGNCIAIGGAAGLLDPIQSTSLHLLQQATVRLIALFPASPQPTREATEYNRLVGADWDRARDMAILHVHANARKGDPLWDHARSMPLPDTLQRKIELYRSRGRVQLLDEELFDESAWITVFDEQGMRPRRYDPLADGIELERLQKHLARLREVIIGAARSLPTSAEYRQRLCSGGAA